MEHQGNDLHPSCKKFITNEEGFDRVGLKEHITFVFQQIFKKKTLMWITIYIWTFKNIMDFFIYNFPPIYIICVFNKKKWNIECILVSLNDLNLWQSKEKT